MAQHIENYWYIGKDNKPITAKELEDQRDALYEALDMLWDWCKNWDAAFLDDSEFDREVITAALAKARGEAQ